jgi:hypothetical protein
MTGLDTQEEVLDPDLWERVSAAIRAVNTVIDAHIEAGKWVPSESVPTLEAFNNSGWPYTRFPFVPSKETPDYSRLFGPTSGDLTPYSYEDIPELAAAIEYVANRGDLARRLSIAPESAQAPGEVDVWLLKQQVANLALSVVQRARALGCPSDEETLLTAYRERERAMLAAELDADLIAPLVLTDLGISEPLGLGDNARLEKLDKATVTR